MAIPDTVDYVIVGGNTNAPVIMIGEKGAEMVKEAARAPVRFGREAVVA